MAVSLPTSADVRKAREQAAAQAELARTPLFAVLGAYDLAVETLTKAVTDARAQAADVQGRFTSAPAKFTTDEVRKAVAEWRAQAEKAYAEFAKRGEQTWDRLRKQPQVEQALSTLENYSEKIDAQVDAMVDDAHDAAEKAFGSFATQSRSTGERFARATQRFTGRAATTVADVANETADAVSTAGAELAETITEAGADVAHESRSVSRKAAAAAQPAKEAPKTGSAATAKAAEPGQVKPARKPAARRTSANGTKSDS